MSLNNHLAPDTPSRYWNVAWCGVRGRMHTAESAAHMLPEVAAQCIGSFHRFCCEVTSPRRCQARAPLPAVRGRLEAATPPAAAPLGRNSPPAPAAAPGDGVTDAAKRLRVAG